VLHIPSGRLDLNHIDINDSSVQFPHPPSVLVKVSTPLALGSPLAGMKASGEGVGSCASEEVGVGLDSRVDAPLVSIDMDLRDQHAPMIGSATQTGSSKYLATSFTTSSQLKGFRLGQLTATAPTQSTRH
jgi:hypothetical protein